MRAVALSNNYLSCLLVVFSAQIIAMAQLAPLVVPAIKKHTATVIWAHGLGDSYAESLHNTQKYLLIS